MLGFILESQLLAESYLKQGLLVPVFDANFSMLINAHYLVFPLAHQKYAWVSSLIEWFKNDLEIV